ncbi:hypothetical protein RCOM_0646550 [Ricinus communis]|uniref:Uncharacterized protein n=1 Tax=Ricinus communis TaxID=3988 RepID=B9SFI9_RICCO|nr:hypothetical protein RCOM_0646550 [Ricinus communis]
MGISINQTLALSLPRACIMQTPPVSRCNDNTPSLPRNPEGTGSKTVPTASGTSEASITRMQFHLTC